MYIVPAPTYIHTYIYTDIGRPLNDVRVDCVGAHSPSFVCFYNTFLYMIIVTMTCTFLLIDIIGLNKQYSIYSKDTPPWWGRITHSTSMVG